MVTIFSSDHMTGENRELLHLRLQFLISTIGEFASGPIIAACDSDYDSFAGANQQVFGF